jgi:hypothetical protein
MLLATHCRRQKVEPGGSGVSSKPPNPRHLRAFADSGKRGRKKFEKGVGFERKMIYLGRHKSWVLWGRNIEQF